MQNSILLLHFLITFTAIVQINDPEIELHLQQV